MFKKKIINPFRSTHRFIPYKGEYFVTRGNCFENTDNIFNSEQCLRSSYRCRAAGDSYGYILNKALGYKICLKKKNN